MTEVQNHGFIFEDWVKNTFFNGYKGGYSDKWDVYFPPKFRHWVMRHFSGKITTE